MVVVETTSEGATSVGKSIINLSSVTTVGLDLAKHVFQVHCVEASGCVVVAKAIRRNKLLEFFASLPPCLVGLEASGQGRSVLRSVTGDLGFPRAEMSESIRDNPNRRLSHAGVAIGDFALDP